MQEKAPAGRAGAFARVSCRPRGTRRQLAAAVLLALAAAVTTVIAEDEDVLRCVMAVALAAYVFLAKTKNRPENSIDFDEVR